MSTGSVADEAARLLEALEDVQRRWHARPADVGGGPECRVCPVCQVLAVVRGTRPDVVEHLLAAAGSLAAALRAAAAPPTDAAAADPSYDVSRRPAPQRIDIS